MKPLEKTLSLCLRFPEEIREYCQIIKEMVEKQRATAPNSAELLFLEKDVEAARKLLEFCDIFRQKGEGTISDVSDEVARILGIEKPVTK